MALVTIRHFTRDPGVLYQRADAPGRIPRTVVRMSRAEIDMDKWLRERNKRQRDAADRFKIPEEIKL
jgi:hypothetical protein